MATTRSEWRRIRGMNPVAHRRDGTRVIEEMYRFTDRLYRAETPNDVYQAALDTITRALGCSRASILLFDDAGVMRFAAWRGLSDAYRRAVEGHSPWTRDVKDPQPVWIQDIEASDLPEYLKETVKAEQIGALAFIPLVTNGALIGKFMPYYDAHRVFSKTDVALAVTIARQLGFSLERWRAEEARRALTESEARFHAAFENAAVGVVLVDPNGSLLRVNDTFARMLGYSKKDLETKSFEDVTHPDDLAANLSVLKKTVTGEANSFCIEKRYVRKDGSIFWASVTVGGVRKTDGGLDYLLSIIEDMTDRKLTEVRLTERNAQLDLAGKIARMGSFTYDHGTKILQLSPGCAAIYGLPEGTFEISRGDWRARVHPDDLPPVDAVARRAFNNGEREFVLEFRIFRDGQVRWIESRVLISYNEVGRPVRTIGAEIDVTERKQAELALAERNMQFALAGKAALVGSYAYDVDTDTMQVDEGYAALHGLSETSTSRSEWKTRAHPEDLDRIETARGEAFQERRSEYASEYRIVRAGSAVRWIESRSFMSYNTEGRPQRVLGVNIDITERKRAEEQLHRLVAELDHRVKNSLATVSAVVSHTSRGSRSVTGFVAALHGRIRSMATTHQLLSSYRWQGVLLTELVERELEPYATRNNTEINGPDILLKPEAGQAMAMVLHELATNAAKYGALSTKNGRVSIRWDRHENGQRRSHLEFEWQEIGAPPVVALGKSGYGTSTIRDLIPYELGGRVDLVLAKEGVWCRLELPADWLR